MPAIDPGMGSWRGGMMRGHHWFANQMQSPNIGRMLRDRIMLLRQVIDKYRYAGIILCAYAVQRLALAPLITEYGQVDTMGAQLRPASVCAMVKQIGQDNDVSV
jgi:hypothetical protein